MSLCAAIGFINGFNECVTLWQWAKSAISSLHTRWSGSQHQDLQGRVLQLKSGLQLLSDTLPAMHDLINKAEWRSHDEGVAKLLPNLKDAVSDAEDLLDEFNWYEKKVQVEGNASQSSFIDFFDTVIQGSFNKLNDVQLRLNHLSSQLDNMGLRGVTQRFDKSVRPETTSLPNETKIFGRDKELKQVLEFLNVRTNSKRKRPTGSVNASTSTLVSKQVINESRISSLPVLAIVGIGGVGKTILAQHICSHQQVKSHFEKIIWNCVSDDFDVKKLTKEAIQSFTEKEAMADSLNTLQEIISNHVKNKRLLVVLDDMWEDALKENGQCWRRFCAPFRSVQEESMILVTTRCPSVTERVCTMEPIILEGLKEDVFWNFFKLCAFGSDISDNDPELECIGRSILPKLKGSPLAAKTLGRMLSMDMQVSHWNFILKSELWELRQEQTDILPALRLSYMYLSFYLKQCFALCAVYPKDYNFQKERLAEIWVAEGFVELQGGVQIHDIGCRYFEDLLALSFFQKAGIHGYVIHDLLHDMAQKVSEHDCFILRNKYDFDKVPQNVRHLYVLPSSEFDASNLLKLCKYTKLRTLICMKNFGKDTCLVMDHWCTKLLRVRVISCASTNELPNSIGNWKHLRYLEISTTCPLKIFPSTLCWLYNLQILYAKSCELESLPNDFCKLISLQRFESQDISYYSGGHTSLNSTNGIRLIKNLKQLCGHLEIANAGILSKDQAAEAQLKNKIYLEELKLNMQSWREVSLESRIIQNKEVLQVLQPPISLKSLFLQNYAGVSLASWFQPQNLTNLKSLGFVGCSEINNISSRMISQGINLNEIPAVGIFHSLTDVTIDGCASISSLEHFLHPDYVPAIKKIRIEHCEMLESVPTEEFGELYFLEELDVCHCPNIRLQRLFSPSLKKLHLWGVGLFCNIDCCSLTDFDLQCAFVKSIQLQTWSLPCLRQLRIKCKSLTSIGVGGSITTLSSLKVLLVQSCEKLPTLGDFLTHEYLPAIEKIDVEYCPELLFLPVERFVSFPCLKHVMVIECPSLKWQRGFVLPSHLQTLTLQQCGDISPYVPCCLQNLTSLVSLSIGGCEGITSIQGDIWSSTLATLEVLVIQDCPNLVSVGGANAVAKIKQVLIIQCPNLKEAEQINRRPYRR